jgi:hypothetical protein
VQRIDERGPETLVQLPEPANCFPDFVRHIVRRLKALCPSMGKVGIAKTLARAGLHLAATTARRMLEECGTAPEGPSPEVLAAEADGRDQPNDAKQRVVTAKYPNHIWHVDLTAMSIFGFRVPWLPFALAQVWPLCWWVAVAERLFFNPWPQRTDNRNTQHTHPSAGAALVP